MLVGALSLGGLVACGGGDSLSPAELSRTDLARDGAFWVELSPEAKRKLVELGKERLTSDVQRGDAFVAAYSTDQLVEHADRVFEDETSRSRWIDEVTMEPIHDADARQAAEQLELWLRGLAARDGKTACEQLTTTYQAALVAEYFSNVPGRRVDSCEKVVDVLADEFEADELKALANVEADAIVDGDEATAKVREGGQHAQLRRIAGRWWINGGLGGSES